MVISKSWNYTLTLEDYEVQPRKLKIVFSRYIENVTNINHSLFLKNYFFSMYKGTCEEVKVKQGRRVTYRVNERIDIHSSCETRNPSKRLEKYCIPS